jgi:hypothetical protein
MHLSLERILDGWFQRRQISRVTLRNWVRRRRGAQLEAKDLAFLRRLDLERSRLGSSDRRISYLVPAWRARFAIGQASFLILLPDESLHC